MFNLHITLAMALTGIKSIVERFGEDHTGSLPEGGCAYVEKQTGILLVASCIVGQFFSDLGILRVLVGEGKMGAPVGGACSLRNDGMFSSELRDTLAENWGITFSEEAFQFLRTCQLEQDGSAQWGQAAETAAKNILNRRGEPFTAMSVLALQADDEDTGKPSNTPAGHIAWVRQNIPTRPERTVVAVKALRAAYPSLDLRAAVDAIRAVYPLDY